MDDDANRLSERVRLSFELDGAYDAAIYSDLLVRACESVVPPMGWDGERIRTQLRDTQEVGFAAFE